MSRDSRLCRNDRCTDTDEPAKEIMDRLEGLTGSLPELDSIESIFGPIVVQNSTDRGAGPQISFGFSAYRDSDISLMRFFIAGGHDIQRHVSRLGNQWIGVIRGVLNVITESGTQTLSQYGVSHIPPETPFSLSAEVDVWFWVLSMPPSPGCPPQACMIPFNDPIR